MAIRLDPFKNIVGVSWGESSTETETELPTETETETETVPFIFEAGTQTGAPFTGWWKSASVPPELGVEFGAHISGHTVGLGLSLLSTRTVNVDSGANGASPATLIALTFAGSGLGSFLEGKSIYINDVFLMEMHAGSYGGGSGSFINDTGPNRTTFSWGAGVYPPGTTPIYRYIPGVQYKIEIRE